MKKYKQQAHPVFTIDASGRRLAHVALSGTTQRATLYAEDMEWLMDSGWSPHWALASTGGRFRYVLTNAHSPKGGHRSMTVARLIAQAGKGQRVTYADGDRLNLRHENLLVVKGGGNAELPAQAIRPRKAEKPERIDPAGRRAPYTPRVIDRAALSA